MKDSKEKEHRISNLKEMINNIQENEEIRLDDGIPEDDELINYLNEDSEDFVVDIDDEFIYRPSENNYSDANSDEEESIDEEFLIKAPKVKETEKDETEEFSDDIVGEISENFDNFIGAKIGGKPILAIASTVIGIILIIISIFIFSSRADRVIDNVVAGETSFIFIIFLAIGGLLIFYGLYRLLNFSNPIDKLINKADADDDDEKNTPKKKIEKPSPKPIPKSEIPLNKDAYKIGEFDMEELKKSLKKPTDSKKKAKIEENSDDIPPAKETSIEKKALTPEEIEHDKIIRDSESIDEIFAEVEDLEELPIISIDSKDNEEE